VQPRIWTFRVRHILESIDKILRYTAGMTYDDFCASDVTVDAVIRNFGVIGEAARHIPDDVIASQSDIPWANMRGMRNVLIHRYDDVRLDIIWDTIPRELPPLVPRLIALHSEEQ
jgi:uncharacterized protein with HEPN domain